LKKIDPEVLQHIANQESKAIASEERRKVKKMLNEGVPLNKIVEQTKLKFYSKEQILLQSHNFEKLADRNSASTRTLYILGGLAMIVLGVGISYASMQSGSRGRLFYGIIIIGIITMFKGFMTVDHVDDI